MHPEAKHFIQFCQGAFGAQYRSGRTLSAAYSSDRSNVGGPGAVSPFLRMTDAPESLEVIIVYECFQHDEDYALSLGRAVEMLQPGGLFMFTCAAADRTADHALSSTAVAPADDEYYRGLNAADVLSAIGDNFRPFFHLYYNAVSKDLYFVGIKNGSAPGTTHSFPTYDAPGVTLGHGGYERKK